MMVRPCRKECSYVSDAKTLEQRADEELDPFQYRLFGHIQRVCADSTDGKCRESTQELAAACKMSAGAVVKAKRALGELGFISIEAGKGTRPDALSSMSPREHKEASVSHDERNEASVHGSVSSGERKPASMSPHECYDEPEAPSVHHMNATALAGAVAVTSALSLSSTQDKDKSLKDKNNTTRAGAREDKRGGGVDTNLPRVVELYEQVTGRAINPIIADTLKDDACSYPLERIEEAAQLTLLAGKTSWRYTQGILKNNGDAAKPRASPAPPVEKRTRAPGLEGFSANELIDRLEREGRNDKGLIPFEGDDDAENLITTPAKASTG